MRYVTDRQHYMRDCGLACIFLMIAATAGCTAPKPPSVVTDEDPSVKIPAIATAVQKKDLGAAKQLVIDLDSDDSAVRFYAIQGLSRLTGQTLGYNYYDSELARLPAIKRWQEWLEKR